MRKRQTDALWAHIHWLGVLADAGSYTAAAERLGVSKAAMSERIRELERAAGVPLVSRTTRSVRLTKAGEQLVGATRGAFEQIERGLADIREFAETPRGLLRVTAPVALGRQQIAPLVPAFLHRHPEVRLVLELSERLSALAQEGFDLAIRQAATVPDTHIAWLLCGTRPLLVASPAYLLRRGAPQRPEELGGHECLGYLRRGPTPAWMFEPAAGNGPRISVDIDVRFAANNSEALRDAALGDAGIALIPDFSAQHDLAAGRLIAVLPDWRAVSGFGERVYAIRPYSVQVPKTVQAFVGFLREALKDGFAPKPATDVG
jgi:DNA-binding transcriptional LysR family regulator